jgi:adenylylsulfate kinase-like enzyme
MREHPKRGSAPFVVTIGGRSGAGKSVISHTLLRA